MYLIINVKKKLLTGGQHLHSSCSSSSGAVGLGSSDRFSWYLLRAAGGRRGMNRLNRELFWLCYCVTQQSVLQEPPPPSAAPPPFFPTTLGDTHVYSTSLSPSLSLSLSLFLSCSLFLSLSLSSGKSASSLVNPKCSQGWNENTAVIWMEQVGADERPRRITTWKHTGSAFEVLVAFIVKSESWTKKCD